MRTTKLTSCIGDQAQCWKIINNLSGAAKRKSVDKIELDNGEVVSDARQVAESINSYLSQPKVQLTCTLLHLKRFFR
ncbi:hypothetical protein J6590_090134 [Homalodisca vitripennis]|nr:hypothetical protein J6590_090134 [Homalodisca vitripennis]